MSENLEVMKFERKVTAPERFFFTLTFFNRDHGRPDKRQCNR